MPLPEAMPSDVLLWPTSIIFILIYFVGMFANRV